MDNQIFMIHGKQISDLSHDLHNQCISSLESGKVIFYPKLTFEVQAKEHALFSNSILAPKQKNISFDYKRQRLNGVTQEKATYEMTYHFMNRFSQFAYQLVINTLPSYKEHLIIGRTSYRPAEIKGRKTSKRQDDTRLHVDAFPSTPVNGLRILRVFCNINPFQEPRVWHLGEPFPTVLNRFFDKLPRFNKRLARVLHWIKATKSLRSCYDHYMLKLHDTMKLDDEYQQAVPKLRFDFPALSSWIVFTDQVSHAALSGQFLLEQTFYLPVAGMAAQNLAPLKQIEARLPMDCVL